MATYTQYKTPDESTVFPIFEYDSAVNAYTMIDRGKNASFMWSEISKSELEALTPYSSFNSFPSSISGGLDLGADSTHTAPHIKVTDGSTMAFALIGFTYEQVVSSQTVIYAYITWVVYDATNSRWLSFLYPETSDYRNGVGFKLDDYDDTVGIGGTYYELEYIQIANATTVNWARPYVVDSTLYYRMHTMKYSQSPEVTTSPYNLVTDTYDPDEASDDPFTPGGSADIPAGGNGDWYDRDDSIDPDDIVPRSPLVLSQFCQMWLVDGPVLRYLSQYLWSTLTDSSFDATAQQLSQRLWPVQDCICGLIALPWTPSSGSAVTPVIYGTSMSFTMEPLYQQVTQIDMGAVYVRPYSDTYLDYNGYTKFRLYLPYIGMVDLATNEIMGKYLYIRYYGDNATGVVLAIVWVTDTDGLHKKIIGEYTGSAGQIVPVGQSQTGDVFGALVQTAVTAVGTIASEGAMTPALVGSVANVASQATHTSTHRGGSMVANAGWNGYQYPYLIREEPIQVLPENQNAFIGYPAFYTTTIGNISGFTIFEEVHLEGLTCSEEEKEEIEKILKSGVIL